MGLKQQLIRLGTARPELRKHIRPVLAQIKAANPLSAFASAVQRLPRVDKVKSISDGIDVYVEGEPVHVVYYPEMGYVREDFLMSVPLGTDVRGAIKAFQQMLDTPFSELKRKFRASTGKKARSYLGVPTESLSDRMGQYYSDLKRMVEEYWSFSYEKIGEMPGVRFHCRVTNAYAKFELYVNVLESFKNPGGVSIILLRDDPRFELDKTRMKWGSDDSLKTIVERMDMAMLTLARKHGKVP